MTEMLPEVLFTAETAGFEENLRGCVRSDVFEGFGGAERRAHGITAA
jgi:hypothetical protein